ncbi:hypothetical protein BBFGKLBO_01861 [Synechococcus sp. CBW1107]|nr:hypothetical protein BBFGKLBO_01861 [Synechococcus sp. CBW1107]
MELRNQLPSSHPLTAPVHPPERVTGPPELHHSEGRYLTTTPNALLRPIHDRMPVVIPDGQEDTWLLASGADELRSLESLLLPWQPSGWEAAPVDLS